MVSMVLEGIFWLLLWPAAALRSGLVGYPTPCGSWFKRQAFNALSIYSLITWWTLMVLIVAFALKVLPLIWGEIAYG